MMIDGQMGTEIRSGSDTEAESKANIKEGGVTSKREMDSWMERKPEKERQRERFLNSLFVSPNV